jgi:hypothetical protein
MLQELGILQRDLFQEKSSTNRAARVTCRDAGTVIEFDIAIVDQTRRRATLIGTVSSSLHFPPAQQLTDLAATLALPLTELIDLGMGEGGTGVSGTTKDGTAHKAHMLLEQSVG